MGSFSPDRESSSDSDTVDIDSDMTEEQNDCDTEHGEEKRLFLEAVELIEGNKIEQLKVDQCKAYLRRHKLRLSGKKQDLLDRIKLHKQLLSGALEGQYAVHTFSIRCTGDACVDDVVLFRQRVYEKNHYLTRTGSIGVRTVAGRVVKESYGADKQQHTFTVEVLWSTGVKPLGPLHQLLIKGRNLYRMNTFRQRWPDEAKRIEVLDEKHKRGAEARLKRASARKAKCKVNAKVSGAADRGRRPEQQRRQAARQKQSAPAAGSHTTFQQAQVRATPADELGVKLTRNPVVQREHKSRIKCNGKKQASPQAVKPVKAKRTGDRVASEECSLLGHASGRSDSSKECSLLGQTSGRSDSRKPVAWTSKTAVPATPTHKSGIKLRKSPVVQRERKDARMNKKQASPRAVKPVKVFKQKTKTVLQMMNVPYSARAQDVHTFLKSYQVAASRVHVLRRNSRPRGTVNLEFNSDAQASKALAVLQSQYFGPRVVHLRRRPTLKK